MVSFIKRIPYSLIFMAIILLSVSACEPRVYHRGNSPREDQLSSLKVGVDNKKSVEKILGSPSTIAPFSSQTWYYISRTTRQFAFFPPKVTVARVVVLDFNDNKILSNIGIYTKDNMKDVSMDSHKTPTYGRKLSILHELFGILGRPVGGS